MEWYVTKRAGETYTVTSREWLDESDVVVSGAHDRAVAEAIRELIEFAEQDAPAYSYISWRRFWAINCALAQLDLDEDRALADVLISVRDLVSRDSWARPETGEEIPF